MSLLWTSAGFDPDEYTGLYHGTNFKLHPGDFITPDKANQTGRYSDTDSDQHVYFTGSMAEAFDYAHRRTSQSGGEPHVYAVKPHGEYEEDQSANVDDAYRSRYPLRVLREIQDL